MKTMTFKKLLECLSTEDLEERQKEIDELMAGELTNIEYNDLVTEYNLISRILWDRDPQEIEPFDLGDWEE